MEMQFTQLLPSPYRNLEQNPIIAEKLKPLIYSISELGWWNNIVVRLVGNDLSQVGLKSKGDHEANRKLLEEWVKQTPKLPANLKVEIAYGHYRIAAIDAINSNPAKYEPINVVDLPLQYIPDEQMLKIMVHENRNEWGHGVMTLIESVQQVYDELYHQVHEFGSYEEYSAKYGHQESAYQTSAAWLKARDKNGEGIGAKKISAFIGGDYGQNDVKGPLMALKAAEKGYFDISECKDLKTGSALMFVVRLIEAIHEKGKVPQYFKDLWTAEILKNQRHPENYCPVSVLKTAKDKFLKGINPIKWIEKQVIQAIDVPALIFEMLWTKEIFGDEAKTLPGFEGWEEELAKGMEMVKARRDKKSDKSAEKSEESGTGEKESGTGEEESGTGEEADGDPMLASTHVVSKLTTSPDIDTDMLIRLFVNESKQFCRIYAGMQNRMSEVDPENIEFFEELSRATTLTVSLFLEAYSKDMLDDLIDNVTIKVEEDRKAKAEAEKAEAEKAEAEKAEAEKAEAEKAEAEKAEAEKVEAEKAEAEKAKKAEAEKAEAEKDKKAEAEKDKKAEAEKDKKAEAEKAKKAEAEKAKKAEAEKAKKAEAEKAKKK